ncbi:DUF748 domain-containing protein [Pseudomonas typographi]|uniref:DUF748 domain-containing protein n=1 Tax=Pseudomonas typographi TaxID=2715964 RepID=A0ABR7Z6A7_9PSED|nr:DUF748 domain-containing protein [Pseudomonas typographi]MBD1553750.1 DUF748 domain-containing protein [Pseudomonas typographi]MBD1601036.1 DUF748 domain-containing protein [Pseudomonas typographi]
MRKGFIRAAIGVLVAIGLYALLGFLLLPGVALRIANQQLAHYSTLPARLERIEFNPFSLELTLWGLHLGAPGADQVAFERLYANLQVDSLWTGALHLAAVTLDKPHTELAFAKDGTLNLAKLFNLPPSEPKPAQPDSKPFPVRIGVITLNEGYLHFKDERPSEPIEFVYDSMNLALKNLSTLPDDNADMTLVADGPTGGRIDWAGQVSLQPIASHGTLKVTDGRLQVWWPYIRDRIPLDLKQGRFSFSTAYQLNLADTTDLKLEQAALTLAPFAVDSAEGKPLLRLERLDVADTTFDLASRRVTLGKVSSDKLEAWAAHEADGQLDWQKLLASPPAKPAEPQPQPPATTAAPPPAAKPDKPWQILLTDVQLRGYQFHLADRQPKAPVALDVGPLNLDLQGFDSLASKPFTVKLDTGVGKQGKLQASGQVGLQPVSAQLKVATQDLDLRVAQAYISPFVRLELRSGMLDSDLAVDLKGTDPLAFSVTGNAQVNQLHTLDTLKSRDFVRWSRLDVQGLDYRQGEGLNIASIALQQPYVRFMINEDQTTNVDDLIIKQPADPAAPPSSSANKGKPMPIRIGGISINEGSANFADFTLTPNFATAIQQLQGKIGTLDNSSPKAAQVDINGRVDRYAPVVIKGNLTPFDPLNSLDIATSFKRVELTTLTPYSGKFAGYRIRKGRLSLDLHYQIRSGKLQAQNNVLVEQLQLGDRVDSPDAVNLPIKLAVALLKDNQGNIAIALPVSGDLNNPQFSVMPIVWQTLRNLLVRAASAPFKLLGGLVHGADSEDLSSVAFAPGSSELDAQAQASLLKLATALKQRPELRLEVEGTSAKGSDGQLLAQQRLEQEYQNTWYKILQRRGDKVPAQASLLQVPDSEKPALLEGIYRARLKQQPPAAWQQLDSDEHEQKLRDAVIGSWSDSTALLRELGQARASAIKNFLVDKGQLADERVFLIDANLVDAQANAKVATNLHLDAD